MKMRVDYLVKNLANFIKREIGYVEGVVVKEAKTKVTILYFLENNIWDVKVIKVVLNKNTGRVRVFTGRRSIDIRLRRYLGRIFGEV